MNAARRLPGRPATNSLAANSTPPAAPVDDLGALRLRRRLLGLRALIESDPVAALALLDSILAELDPPDPAEPLIAWTSA